MHFGHEKMFAGAANENEPLGMFVSNTLKEPELKLIVPEVIQVMNPGSLER